MTQLRDPPGPPVVRRRLRVRGVVQGVGFRPFVYRLATERGLSGHVGNDPAGVFIEIEGLGPAVDEFCRVLCREPPPLARLERIEAIELATRGDAGFRIVESRSVPGAPTFVPPDVAVCEQCVGELFDPADRRYRYPFITCTNCGPRFTIATALPYDRPNTTMRGFPLCEACSAEYADPADRRYHAESVACAACGPHVRFEGPSAATQGTDAAIAASQRLLASGGVLAVKGLGGYHLACDATSAAAVQVLRERKHRPVKPLAVMVPDLDGVRRIACVDDAEAGLLTSPAHPIVLVRARRGTGIADAVAPGTPFIGVFLPYTPLHHLLFAPVPGADVGPCAALVMTSGNLSEEPIAFADADARERLAGLVDGWLVHDRPIHVPCDDSVTRVVQGVEVPVRRSRGYAPLPVRLPVASPPVLAVGADLKNTFCLAVGQDARISQHLGDMGGLESFRAFERATAQFGAMYGVERSVVVADLHPGYRTRQWADDSGVEVLCVQHHHAHVAALMTEHEVPLEEPVIGFAFDGTGYGTDGAIWGGEVLVATYAGFERAAHLRYVPLPGGDHAVRKPYRVALTHLRQAGIPWADDLPPVGASDPLERRVLERQLERNVRCVPTSSMGRLFDAVSSLLGIRHIASFEGQAAIELELAAADAARSAIEPSFALVGGEIDPAPVLRAMVAGLHDGVPSASLAAAFHGAVASMMVTVAERVRMQTGVTTVGLTGGVFQNLLLTRLAAARLAASGFRVLTHRIVPPNDGGIALGQAAVAGARLRQREAS
ncbi:MAG: (NiFe) hydrogenase maturation protein HypF [Actinomycetia bacterium]|nr:(NiFe) hydrogenase maturation protein HypF [Actinomycetes bacterium]